MNTIQVAILAPTLVVLGFLMYDLAIAMVDSIAGE